jgi:hypothetical protein
MNRFFLVTLLSPANGKPTVRVPAAKRLGIGGVLLLLALSIEPPNASGAGAGIPHLCPAGSATQLVVDGQPWVMLSGELHNSSSSSLQSVPMMPRGYAKA